MLLIEVFVLVALHGELLLISLLAHMIEGGRVA